MSHTPTHCPMHHLHLPTHCTLLHRRSIYLLNLLVSLEGTVGNMACRESPVLWGLFSDARLT